MTITLLGPYNSGLAVGAEGAALMNTTIPLAVHGWLNSLYIKHNIAATVTTDVIVNGTFDADSDWTKGANWTIPAAKKATAAAAVTNLTAAVDPLTIASVYYVTYDLVVTLGSVRISDGVNVGPTRTVSGSYTELFTAGAAAFLFKPVAAFTGTIDNVKAYEYDPHLGTEVTISTGGVNLPAYNLLVVTGSVTDAMFRPRSVPDGTVGAPLAVFGSADMLPITDQLNIKIDLAVAGDNVDVWFLVEEDRP